MKFTFAYPTDTISYVLVLVDERDSTIPYFLNNLIGFPLNEFLKCPHSILQIRNPHCHSERVAHSPEQGLSLRFLIAAPRIAKSFFRSEPFRYYVFFVDSADVEWAKEIAKIKRIAFFPVSGCSAKELGRASAGIHAYSCGSAEEIRNLFMSDYLRLESYIPSVDGADSSKTFTPFRPPLFPLFSNFRPNRVSLSILDHISGHSWGDRSGTILMPRMKDRSLVVAQTADEAKRLLDGCIFLPRQIVGHEPRSSPLILSVPYCCPYFKKALNETRDETGVEVDRLLSLEQDADYLYRMDLGNGPEIERNEKIGMLTSLRTESLDLNLYLHAALTLSPAIRLPIIGRSINNILSQFSPTNFPRKKYNNLMKSIDQMGKRFSDLLLNDKSEAVISNADRQIVAITDLPVEWMKIGQVPLGFSHDICRIPETPSSTLLKQAAVASLSNFSIGKDIIKRTVVIHGASQDANVMKYSDILGKEARELGAEVFIVKGISHLVQILAEKRPQLLILDTHGTGASDTGESQLLMGSDILTIQDVIDNSISAPIVMISACWAAPNFGFPNAISRAFLDVGAQTVIAPMIPVEATSAVRFCCRILANLNKAKDQPFHKNLLSFLSHIRRTDFLFSIIFQGKHSVSLDLRQNECVDWMSRMMISTNRRVGYEEMWKLIASVTSMEEEEVEEFLGSGRYFPEFFTTTFLGRPDLVLFDSWQAEYQKVLAHANDE